MLNFTDSPSIKYNRSSSKLLAWTSSRVATSIPSSLKNCTQQVLSTWLDQPTDTSLSQMTFELPYSGKMLTDVVWAQRASLLQEHEEYRVDL